MINVGDIVVTNETLVGSEYESAPEGTLVIAYRPEYHHYLIFVRSGFGYGQNIEFYRTQFAHYNVIWIDEIKIVNPDNKLLWYSGNALIKIVQANMPDGTRKTITADPILDSIVTIEKEEYRIDEISVDESMVWVEPLKKRKIK